MIKATYENIPTGSMQNSTTTGNYAQPFVDWNDFKIQRSVFKYATLERNRWLLDGSFINFPNEPIGLGYISTSMSDANGDFVNDIVITRTYTINYTSPGLMIEFDTNTDDYAADVNVKWYRDSTLLSDLDYTVDSAMYFCENPVTAYNKIVIRISSMNKPYRFLKIFNLSDGIVREFYDEELENVQIIEQVESDNQTISINELNAQILPKNKTGILFQRTLPFKIYRNDILYGDFFISKSKSNTSKTIYNVTADDYISVLDGQVHMGGMYNNVNVPVLIADIMGTVPYILDNSLASKKINGYLPIQKRRDALRCVAFCLNAMVDTSRSDVVTIKPYPETQSSSISKDRIVSVETTEENIKTKFEINTVIYQPNSEVTEIYNETVNGTIYVTFSQPMHDLSIVGGTIVQSDVNYAIISGSGNVVLSGQGYEQITQTISKTNPYTVSTDIEKVESMNTTIVSNNQTLLNSYKFIQFKIKSTFKLSAERVGDIVDLNGQQARITSLSYNLAQTNIYVDAELEAYYG